MIISALEQTQISCESFFITVPTTREHIGKGKPPYQIWTPCLHIFKSILCLHTVLTKYGLKRNPTKNTSTMLGLYKLFKLFCSVPTNCQNPFLFLQPFLSHTFISPTALNFISIVHISGFVFDIVQHKLVWDSLGSHLSPMQCFSSFIKFKIGPIPGGEEDGRGGRER